MHCIPYAPRLSVCGCMWFCLYFPIESCHCSSFAYAKQVHSSTLQYGRTAYRNKPWQKRPKSPTPFPIWIPHVRETSMHPLKIASCTPSRFFFLASNENFQMHNHHRRPDLTSRGSTKHTHTQTSSFEFACIEELKRPAPSVRQNFVGKWNFRHWTHSTHSKFCVSAHQTHVLAKRQILRKKKKNCQNESGRLRVIFGRFLAAFLIHLVNSRDNQNDAALIHTECFGMLTGVCPLHWSHRTYAWQIVFEPIGIYCAE